MRNTFTFLQGVRFILFFWALILLYTSGYSQTGCSCPPVSTCGACQGGLNNLVLKYTGGGTVVALVVVDGAGNNLHPDFDAASKIITINSLAANQAFQNGSVNVKLIAVLSVTLANETIITSCGSPIYEGSVFGDLKVMSATSVTGGTLCCASTDVDHTAPVFTNCPNNIILNTSPGSCTASTSWTPPTATDNCGPVTVTSTHDYLGTTFPPGTTTVSYTAKDEYDNTSTCSFTVQVIDNIKPVFTTCPANFNVNVSGSCSYSVVDFTGMATASDNCDNSVDITQSPIAGTILSGAGTTQLITLTATDDSGNTNTCTFTITLKDEIDPTFTTCPGNFNVNVNASCSYAIIDYTGLATAADNCDNNVTITQFPAAGTVLSGAGTSQLITLTATDDSGNTNTCTFTITLKDNIKPTFTTCPANSNVNLNGSCSYSMADFTGLATASDNCNNNVVITQSPAVGTVLSGAGTTQLVTLTATDDSGNTNTCAFTITMKDNINPTFTTCPGNFNVNLNGSCSYSIVDYRSLANASDNCDNSVTITQSPAIGTVLSGGGMTQLITLTATDDSGNTSVCTFTITLKDNIKPTFTTCPGNLNVNVNGSCAYAIIDYTGMATASDNCDNSVTISQSPAVGTILTGVGTTQSIKLTATDDFGNTSACTFTITLEDNAIPTFTACPGDFNVKVDGNSSYTIPDYVGMASASDNCDNSVTITQSPVAGTVLSGVGTTQLITLTATDDYGNINTCNFTITLENNPITTFTCPGNFNVSVDGNCSYSVTDFTGMATCDNCDNSVTVTQSPAVGTVLSGVGTTQLITLTATDALANTISCTFTITLKDNIKPIFTSCPANLDVDVNGNCSYSIPDYSGMATASDNCDNSVTITQSPAIGTVLSNAGTTQLITLTATDDSGNTNTCTFTITLKDNISPTFATCPGNFNVNVNGSCSYSIADYTAMATAFDNCDEDVSITQSPTAGTLLSGVGTTQLITLTATDDSGNTGTCTFTITLKDNIKPTFTTCPANFDVNVNGTCSYSIVDYTGMATATDNCDNNVSIIQSPAIGTVLSGVGMPQVITLTATDDSGNTNTCTFTITLKDNINPVFTTCPADFNVNLNQNCSYTIGDYTAMATAFDNCDNTATITQSPVAGTILSGAGTTQLITLTATDASANTTTCTFTITLKDNIKPTFTTCPVNFNVNVNGSCSYTIADYTGMAMASDNCDNSVTITQSPVVGTVLQGAGTTQLITITASDDSGNTSTCSFIITLKDNVAPAFTSCPANFDVNVNGSCSYAIVDYTDLAMASDNCDNNVTVTQSPAIGTLLSDVGTTQLITLTATDDSGNNTTCTFTITLKDNISPAFTSSPGNFDVNVNGSCSYSIVDYTGMAIASDNCGNSIAITQSPAIGTVLSGVGTSQLITLTATDDSGNTSTCTFTITLKDNIAPAFTTCPLNFDVNVSGNCSYSIPDYTGMASAYDNCDNSVTITQSPVMGTVLSGMGTTQIITLTATDDAGNTTTCSFTITLKDTISPVIDGCPSDISVSSSGNCGAIVTWTSPTVSDNCAAILNADHHSGDFFAIGQTTVLYTAIDENGNTASCSFGITVTDDVSPFISDLTDITVHADAFACGAIVTWDEPVASDNCTIDTLIADIPPASTFPVGTTLVTYTAKDIYENSSTRSFHVVVVDATAPVMATMPDLNIVVNSSCDTVATWADPVVTDNCGVASLVSDIASGSTFSIGTTTVTYTVTDVNGNVSVGTFNVNIEDQMPPVMSTLSDITVAALPGTCHAIVTWETPSAHDNCEIGSLVSDIELGTAFNVGTNTVTYTAIDTHGNTSSRSFNVVVLDNDAPAIKCVSDLYVAAESQCGVYVTWSEPFIEDCSTTTVTSTRASGSFFGLGSTLVTYTAQDIFGNQSSCTFKVVVEDKSVPVFSNVTPFVNASAVGSCNASVSWTVPEVSDNCSSVTLTSSHQPGDLFPIGITQVTYAAADSSGNTSTWAFNVVVTDGNEIIFENCPSEIQVKTANEDPVAVAWTEPIAKSGCGAISVTSSHKPGDLFPLGTTEVVYSYSDKNGHSKDCRFNVVVSYDEVQFDISKVVTPDGNGVNDVWILANIEKFANNKVTVVDRWGSVIFSARGYDNNAVVWNGENQRGGLVPTGTYFFTISVQLGPTLVEKSGFIELIR